MKQLDLFLDEPLYVATDDDYSGPHGDVREDFIELTRGVPAARGHWECRRCRTIFRARKPCKHHMKDCPDLWHELNDNDKAIAIRAGAAMFEASKHMKDRLSDRPKSLEEEVRNMGAQMALARMLQWCPALPPAYGAALLTYDPINYVNSYGEIADIPIGPGIEVRWIENINHHLTVRPDDHKDRIFANMLGKFPRYGFAGFLIPAEVQNIINFRDDYGHKNVPACYALPRHLKGYRLEDLIELL